MVLFGENPQVSEFVKGMDKGLELLGFDSEEEKGVVSEGKSVGGVSEGKSVVSEEKSVVSEEKSVGGVNEEKVNALTTGKKTPTTEACTPWLTLRNRMTPHKHMHGESGKP